MRGVVLVLVGLLCAQCAVSRDGKTEIVVLAAASLTDAMEALALSFETAHPDYRIVLSVGGTSLLARQIEQGAPADAFFSANLAWLEHLKKRGRISGPVVNFLDNRLVIVGREDQPVFLSLSDLAHLRRVALADPEHVPAGVYAREGLVCAGLWDTIEAQIVPTIDVRAALLSVQSGAADVAIVYASDVHVASSVHVLLEWPDDCAPEIRYGAAMLHGASSGEGARHLVAFVTDSSRAELWEQFGFLPQAQVP